MPVDLNYNRTRNQLSSGSTRTHTGNRLTDKGTPIVKPGEDMNKNAFMNILAAELANQDPTQQVDSTAYVSQMAQFAAMEQMTNLNETMSEFAAHSIVGKGVTLKALDINGQAITGVVKAVTNQNGKATISVEISENGKNTYKDYQFSDIITVLDVPDYSVPPLTNINGNMSFLVASSFIGKNIEFNEKVTGEDGKVNTIKSQGEVISVYKENGEIKMKIKNKDGEYKSIFYTEVNRVAGKVEDLVDKIEVEELDKK